MATTDWSRYGIRPSGDPKSRRFTVTADEGVNVSGHHYAKGSSIARRQGENLRFAVDRSDWHSWDEWQRARAGQGRFSDYPAWVGQASRERGRSEASVRNDPAFNRAYLGWQRAGRPRGNAPTGRLARLLTAAGLRPAGATYRVGRSPGYKQAGKITHRKAA